MLACYIVTHRLARFFGLAWLPLQMQVRLDDQSQYPEVTIESFVGQRSMGLLCPPAVSVFSSKLLMSFGTGFAHAHPRSRVCVTANL